jgi:iron(III) transport system substrate-binding protein
MIKRSLGILGAAALAAVMMAAPAYAQRTKLTMYTAIENDQLGPFKQAIEAAVPDVEIVWVRDSTGVMTARFLAEKDNPRADVVFGLAVTSLMLFEKQGLLETYEPKGASALKPAFRDAIAPYTWTGMDAYLSVLCFNTAEGKKNNVATPTSWQDITKPEYKGKIIMPHPASSGTGYLTVSAWMQIMGEKAAWEFMDKLHDNIAVYTHSGSIDIVLPKEGAGWELEATSIVKGTKNLELAKKVADWGASKQASELYSKYYAIVAEPSVKNTPPNYPTNAEQAMVKNDFLWMAENRERILAEWSKRYESKAAPKN